MDLALTVFRFGVGAGALLIGLALLILVFSLRGLGRDARTLSADLQRLNRLLAGLTREASEDARPWPEEPEGSAVHEAPPTVREPMAAEPAARSVERWPPPSPPDEEPSIPVEEEVVGWWPGGASDGPVQSADEREDERIA
jgi:hypothetical protein